ncbi:hypothetical protein IWX58_000071 [Rubrivivax gelatinosus]|uniref:DUF2145 domain-containing protein n=2 Tax=Rubrivivax gelatinosus TaxID=28068 RepID=UPI0018CB7516|nr:DUF2145 domain-containing protein [Rubrivivax gelatinosus]MBG6078384.1 hypothetical protein [Rubrivivax gelatinosus]
MRRAAAAAALLAGVACGAQAGLPGLCDRPATLSAAQQHRLLQLAALIRRELQASDASAALIARSGTDLGRFGIRYSHAALALHDNPLSPWAVRQLYYACDEARPRLFDQGLAGFVSGTDDAERGFVSVLLLPPEDGRAVQAAALDKRRALRLLGAAYSANAYAWATTYQNCNQWVAELLADAWQPLADGPAPRAEAQAWLRAQGYEPTPVAVGSHALVFAAQLVPYVHAGDHPLADLQALTMRVSLPASIEAFVQRRLPGMQRLEFCHAGGRAVVRRGGPPLPADCSAGPGDELVALDD